MITLEFLINTTILIFMKLFYSFFAFLLVSVGTLNIKAQTTPQQIHLWEAGAPGFENRKDEPEQAKDWWVKNIHNPSITVFLPPKEKATGVGVIICPGGGTHN